MPAKSEAEEKFLPMEEAFDCSQENKGIKDVTAVKDVHSTEMEGAAASKSQSITAEKRAVVRAESAETQDYASGQQRLEELGQEDVEELSIVPTAVGEPRWALAHLRQSVQRRKLQVFTTCGCCDGRGSSHNQLVQRRLKVCD